MAGVGSACISCLGESIRSLRGAVDILKITISDGICLFETFKTARISVMRIRKPLTE